MNPTITSQLLAFVAYFLYASFFEWAFHKYLFHSNKFIKATFRAHNNVHHLRYKYSPSSYECREGRAKEHIAMDWFALPLFVGFHLPFQIAIQYFTGIPSVWGGVGAVVAYYFIYEYFHYAMHVPKRRGFENFFYFKFAKEHHRIHHKHFLKNLNVFFPLADLCLGTFISAKESREEDERLAAERANSKPAPREKVAAR